MLLRQAGPIDEPAVSSGKYSPPLSWEERPSHEARELDMQGGEGLGQWRPHGRERWPQSRGLGISGNYEAGKTSHPNFQTFPE